MPEMRQGVCTSLQPQHASFDARSGPKSVQAVRLPLPELQIGRRALLQSQTRPSASCRQHPRERGGARHPRRSGGGGWRRHGRAGLVGSRHTW
jgi:hypothetical protein